MIEELVERGDDVVVAIHLTARGRGSGAEVDVRLYPHVRVQDGMIVYVFEYDNRAEALRAIGVESA